MDKTGWRRDLRNQRRSISPSRRRSAARSAARRAIKLLPRGRCRVAAYWPIGSELDSRPLLRALQARGCQVYLPALSGKTKLSWDRLLGQMPHRPLLRRALRITVRNFDLIFLPLLACDRFGTRLGQGGGHYDRALAPVRHRRRPLRIGFAFDLQRTTPLPRERHDVRLHALVTDQRITRFRY